MWYYCVIVFDLCGYGEIDKFVVGYDKCNMVCDFVVLFDVFGIECIVFVGYDCGVCVVMCFVKDFFECVEWFVVMDNVLMCIVV